MPEEQKQEKIEIGWVAPEFIRYEKGQGWFVVFFAIAAVFLIISVLMKNYVFSLIIILAAFTIFVQAQKKPKKIKFLINEKGITVGSDFHAYSNVKSFWIFENEEMNYISVESKKTLRPHFYIPLVDQDVDKVRNALGTFVYEVKQEESALDVLARRLRY